jgi:hypothetical protein
MCEMQTLPFFITFFATIETNIDRLLDLESLQTKIEALGNLC